MTEEYRQGDPYCVQIELTEGCNLRCVFCGLNSIRGKDNDYKTLTVETATLIAQGMADAGWTSRLEFAMHGEPTMNKDAEEILAIFRAALPGAYMLMESNGGGIIGKAAKRILALFNAGLNCLALDQYQGINLVPKIKAELAEALHVSDLDQVTMVRDADLALYSYPSSGPKGNPHQRHTRRRLVFVEPIDLATKGTHSTINNHAGCGAPPNEDGQGKRCAKPFREISFRWDGSVAVCCNDWRGVYVVGNVHSASPSELWHDPRMYAARRRLYVGRRDFGPCRGCDATSYRVGLLPDHKGQVELEPSRPDDEEIIAGALADGPLTAPVARSWEKQP